VQLGKLLGEHPEDDDGDGLGATLGVELNPAQWCSELTRTLSDNDE
jgi:hypothetical protein